jgi:peroxiredoxin Q/BCP
MLRKPRTGTAQPTDRKLVVGDKAPDFVLPDQDNRPTHFADMLGKGAIILFFYPKDYSPGCTAEVCAFRDSFEAFNDAGATVIGVSADTSESHRGFADRNRLPFILLSDVEGSVHELYGVEKTFGIFRARVTFIIDKQGIVRHSFSSQLNIEKHIVDALQVIAHAPFLFAASS